MYRIRRLWAIDLSDVRDGAEREEDEDEEEEDEDEDEDEGDCLPDEPRRRRVQCTKQSLHLRI